MKPARPLLTAILLALFVQSHASGNSDWLFVSLLKEQVIVAFQRDVSSGKLLRRATTSCPAEPGVLAISPDRQTLFVAFRSSGELTSFRIDHETGQLKNLGVVAGGDDPAYLDVSADGRFLLTAYYIANKVTIHKIKAGGVLSTAPLQTVPTAKNAHAIEIEPERKFAYVPHTGANRIYQFRFDPAKGKLEANSPAWLELSPGDQPRHVAIHHSGRWVYANNEAGDSLNVLEVNANGTLRRIQREPTIPR